MKLTNFLEGVAGRKEADGMQTGRRWTGGGREADGGTAGGGRQGRTRCGQRGGDAEGPACPQEGKQAPSGHSRGDSLGDDISFPIL